MPDATFFNFSLVLVVLAAALDVLANMLLAAQTVSAAGGRGCWP